MSLISKIASATLAVGLAAGITAEAQAQNPQVPIEWRFVDVPGMRAMVSAYEADTTSHDPKQIDSYRKIIRFLSDGSVLVTRKGNDENYSLFLVQTTAPASDFLVSEDTPYGMHECTFKKGNLSHVWVDANDRLTSEKKLFEVTWNRGYRVNGLDLDNDGDGAYRVAMRERALCSYAQTVLEQGKKVTVGSDSTDDVRVENKLFSKLTAKYRPKEK